MVRTVWFTVVALAATLALTVAAPAASGGGDGCPGQYGQYFVPSVDDPLFFVDKNGNGYVCEYVGKGTTKEPFIDDNNKPSKKQQ
jgi:hypothetical protein